ncbi:MAG: DUF1893 domain-containing protein [Bacillota bacterium]|nr:DUF1893 domain-containing protein [Candidatus Fermentithermobacillaceae bacterium]
MPRFEQTDSKDCTCSKACRQDEHSISLSLESAKQQIDSGWSSVLVADGKVLDREKGSGIKPALLILQRMGQTARQHPNLVFGDRVLGLAAFRLGVLMRARAMWGGLVSQPVLAEAAARGIQVDGREFVPSILNRTGDGLCPMERLSASCDSDAGFYSELLERLQGS